MHPLLCEVAVNFPLKDSVLTYSIVGAVENYKVGMLVEVPLGRRTAKGCIVSIGAKESGDFDNSKIKAMVGPLANGFLLSEAEIELYKWISRYYHYSLGKLIFDCLPKILKRPRTIEVVKGLGQFEEFEATPEQKVAIEGLEKKVHLGFDRFYLHGVTGSGKTYVYLKMLKEVLKKSKSVLFMLPEINLTPQFIEIFQTQLECEVLSFHSGVSNSHKYSIWKKLKEETGPFLVMGVRSSVFLPIKNLGLIIVDEEHDSSFKQVDRCPYNARDVAVKKSQIADCPVIMGSATPSMENYFAFKDKENYFQMQKRIGESCLPKVILLDEREKLYDENTWPFHQQSIELIGKILAKKEQIIVFNNRLGFANFLQCRACGHTFTDPNTDTNLRYFKSRNRLVSMHSEYWIPMPEECPECGNLNLLQKGYGTEKIAEVLQSLFPQYKIGRFDRAEIKNFDELGKTLNQFHAGDIDLLVGTQMLSKGHNFKKVNNVFILGTDSQLNWPDFRSNEKVFQLLMQVCGRAGRFSKEGKVYIQTLNVDSDIYQYVQKQNVAEFYESEVPYRQALGYPPYAHLATLYLSHRFKDKLENECELLSATMLQINNQNKLGVDVWGPTPLVIEKRAGQFTWCYLLKSEDRAKLHQFISGVESFYKPKSGISIKIDVDPYTVL